LANGPHGRKVFQSNSGMFQPSAIGQGRKYRVKENREETSHVKATAQNTTHNV